MLGRAVPEPVGCHFAQRDSSDALLHHPQYRTRYAENLKRDLPHIPLLSQPEAFAACVRIGKALMELHLTYEQVKEYPLKWVENEDGPSAGVWKK